MPLTSGTLMSASLERSMTTTGTRPHELDQRGMAAVMAFDQLVTTPSWNTLLNGATGCANPVTPVRWANVTVPNLARTFSVSLRNDCAAGDNLITGVFLYDQVVITKCPKA